MILDSVFKQPCTVPYWERGSKEIVRLILNDGKSVELKSLALGNSIGTGPKGITAKVLEVKSLDEVEELGKEVVGGKIVFYNRPMDPTQLRTFNAYGGGSRSKSIWCKQSGRIWSYWYSSSFFNYSRG